ncbi:MAG: type II secretion system protein GspG [Verrucomicrobiota bacterium]
MRSTVLSRKFVSIALALLIAIGAASWCVYQFTGGVAYSKENRVQSDLQMLVTQVDLYKAEHGHYPVNAEGLAALANRSNLPNYHQFLMFVPIDPWGNGYRYAYPGIRNTDSFDVYSFGPDGKKSGDDLYPSSDTNRKPK